MKTFWISNLKEVSPILKGDQSPLPLGFIALRIKTWIKEQVLLVCTCSHVSITNFGARVASQRSPIPRVGSDNDITTV